MAIETFEGLPIVDTGGRSLISALDAKKISFPNDGADFGNSGDQLRSLGDGGVEWAAPGMPTYEQTEQAISDWLDAHPEATTTVADGAITDAKLNDALKRGLIYGFETVADMKAADTLTAGMICHTNGFHASGDGGAAWYEITDTGTANEMDVIACGDLFAVLVSDKLNPCCYGAIPDGVTDCTSAINICVNNANDNDTIVFPNGVYSVDSIELKSNVNYDFCNSVIKGNSSNITISGSGTLVTSVTPSSELTQGNRFITVENAANINSGMILVIESTEQFTSARTYYKEGFVTQVESIDNNVLRISKEVPFTMASNSVTISVYEPFTAVIENIGKVYNDYQTTPTSLIQIDKAANVVFENVNVEHLNEATEYSNGIRIYHAFNTVVSNSHIKAYKGLSVNVYGINVSSSNQTLIENCIINSDWAAISTGGEIPVIDTNINNCVLMSQSNGVGFGSHSNEINTIIENSTIENINICDGIVRQCNIVLSSSPNIIGRDINLPNVCFEKCNFVNRSTNIFYLHGTRETDINVNFYDKIVFKDNLFSNNIELQDNSAGENYPMYCNLINIDNSNIGIYLQQNYLNINEIRMQNINQVVRYRCSTANTKVKRFIIDNCKLGLDYNNGASVLLQNSEEIIISNCYSSSYDSLKTIAQTDKFNNLFINNFAGDNTTGFNIGSTTNQSHIYGSNNSFNVVGQNYGSAIIQMSNCFINNQYIDIKTEGTTRYKCIVSSGSYITQSL